jgi:ABC-type dipeptide/oligopeptide/nickel transport system ATPase component
MEENMTHASPDAPPVREAVTVQGMSIAYVSDDRYNAVVNDVSFSLQQSDRLAIVGESGSGKTTLAMAVAGLLPSRIAKIDCPTASIAGKNVDMSASVAVIPTRRQGVSMIFQDAMTSLDPVASIGHQFRTVLGSLTSQSRSQIRKEAVQWLDKVGIHEPERVIKLHSYEMSGGMRQRVMIALALCSKPLLLIADEPTSALDASVSRRVMDLILELTAELGTALIIITHDIDLAREYTNKSLVLYHGHVQDFCDTAQLGDENRSPYTRSLLACVPRLNSYDLDALPTLDHNAALTKEA